jgi:hypothetical protein
MSTEKSAMKPLPSYLKRVLDQTGRPIRLMRYLDYGKSTPIDPLRALYDELYKESTP